MNLKLKDLRVAAGYDRETFATMLNITERKLKSWETQETKITLRDAMQCADLLQCSLDDLAGRKVKPNLSDRQANMLVNDYMQLSKSGQAAAAGAVRGILTSEIAQGTKENLVYRVAEARS